MSRVFPLASAVLLSSALCTSANADPDRNLVRIMIADESATVTVSGRTHIDVVRAVFETLAESRRPCETITVGPWLQLPDNPQQDSKTPSLTVCIDDRMEGGKTTAFIAVSKEVPVAIIFAMSHNLNEIGYDDVRLLSETTLRQYLTEGG